MWYYNVVILLTKQYTHKSVITVEQPGFYLSTTDFIKKNIKLEEKLITISVQITINLFFS